MKRVNKIRQNLMKVLSNHPYYLDKEKLERMSVEELYDIKNESDEELDHSDLFPNDDEYDDSRNWE